MTRASDISDDAARWLIRLEGLTSPEVWDEFQAWMDADARHRAAFVRLREGWNRVCQLKNLRPDDGTIDADLLERAKADPRKVAAYGLQPLRGAARRAERFEFPVRRRVLAAAAALVVAGFIAWLGSSPAAWSAYETGVGGHQEIALTDGSTVDLNTNTELSTRISGSRREIILTRGEALFHVAHDTSRPFFVTAGGTVVRAVGTAFSVRIRAPGHVEVLVSEGQVAVGVSGTPDPTLLAMAPRVSANQSATVGRDTVAVRALASREIARRLSWTAGRLSFQGETLEEAVAEFNRYNQRQIAIADPAIRQERVGGTFRVNDPDSFVAALRRSFGICGQPSADGTIRLTGTKPGP